MAVFECVLWPVVLILVELSKRHHRFNVQLVQCNIGNISIYPYAGMHGIRGSFIE